MNRRTDEDSNVRIVREVPLWGIVLLIISGLGAGVATYYGQQSQGEAIQRLTIRVVELTVKIEQLSENVNARKVKDAEVTFRLADHDRRIDALEKRK